MFRFLRLLNILFFGNFWKFLLFKKLKRAKSQALKELKSKLFEEFECIETESKCMQAFQQELELLIQEKLAHLEELRQIQADIQNVNIFESLLILLKNLNFYCYCCLF